MTQLSDLQTTAVLGAPIRQRYEQIADQLVAELRAGRLVPGQRLPAERDLAQRLGVGRASVREALGALQVRGIVETRAGSGSFLAADAASLAAEAAEATDGGGSAVLPPDAGPVAVLEARLVLEPAIARKAAEHGGSDPECDRLLDVMAASADPADPGQRRAWSEADRLFHRQVAVRTANPVLIAMAEHLARLMDQPLWQRLRDDAIALPGRTTLQLAEHRLISAAIDEGEPDAAEQHSIQHIQRARRYMALDRD
jgi:DNA-binding FadR family transcriptional regulator